MECGIVYITTPTRADATRLARQLVAERLAACAQIVGDIQSRYWWQGCMHDRPEVLLMAKTTRRRFVDLEAAVQRLHPYEVPEVVYVPITAASPAYLAWIRQETADA